MSASSIVATKILVISSGVVFIGMTMKLTIMPWVIKFSVSEVPMIWSFLVSLCKPPYLYVVINGIIITIAASSRFTRTEREMESSSSSLGLPLISAKTPPLIEIEHGMYVAEEVVMVHGNKVVEEVELVAMEELVQPEDEDEDIEEVKESMEALDMQPQEPKLVLPVRENHRPLSRFGPPKPTPQGKREVIIEEEVTLESMWKTIMEGREEQSIKESDIMKECRTQKVEDESRWKAKGGASYLSESPIKSWILKKEPTLGQDELNRRADEFIQKFNEEMRMQRLQSLNQNINIIATHH